MYTLVRRLSRLRGTFPWFNASYSLETHFSTVGECRGKTEEIPAAIQSPMGR